MKKINNFPEGLFMGWRNQCLSVEGAWNEDGKGVNIVDILPHGSREAVPKDHKILPDVFILPMAVLISITPIRRISDCLRRWV